jgi:hypothetical protein
MQIAYIVQLAFLGIVALGFILIMLYLVSKTFTGGTSVRSEHQRVPRSDEMTVTQGSHVYDTSYSPVYRASDKGPLPLGGRVEREPTRSFSSYTNPRKRSKKSESEK